MPLQLLPFDKINELCGILKEEWPASIFAINFLQSCADRKKKNSNFDVLVYSFGANIQSGAFVAILKSGYKMPFVTLYALDSCNCEYNVEQILLHLPLNWNEKILFRIPSKFSTVVEKMVAIKSCRILHSMDLTIFTFTDLDRAKRLETDDPFGVEIRQLSEQHLKEVYQSWHMQETNTICEIYDAFQLHREFAMGVFCKKTDGLLGWCLRTTYGGIGYLHIRNEARGRGYAKLLTRRITKKMAELSIEPFATIRDPNEISIRVFAAVGFTAVSHLTRMLICK